MPEQNSSSLSEETQSALVRMLRATLTLPAQITFYASALGAIALASQADLPSMLATIAAGVGVNALSSILERTARGEPIADDEIRAKVLAAIEESRIEQRLADHDTQRLIAGLYRRHDMLRFAVESHERAILERLTEQGARYNAFFINLQESIQALYDEVKQVGTRQRDDEMLALLQRVLAKVETGHRPASIQNSQIGVLGDHAHVEGGIHFDQREQRVEHQVNVAGDYVYGDKVGDDKIIYGSPSPLSLATDHTDERLKELGFGNPNDASFGCGQYTADCAFRDVHYVAFVAIPVIKVDTSPTNVLGTAKQILTPENWYQSNPDNPPPKYWPPAIFKIPGSRRSAQNAFVWEEFSYDTGNAKTRLVITGTGEVLFVSRSPEHVGMLRNGPCVFILGPFLADCWRLSGLVAQLHHDIGYSGKTRLCIGMIETENTHLGGYADGWLTPWEPHYWSDVLEGHDWSCHSPNLLFCDTVNLMTQVPQKQPEFIWQFAEAISQAYNHDCPRCFDRETGEFPARFFNR